MTARRNDGDLRERLAHIRWIGGGTGAGKSTVAAVLAGLSGLDIYDGDRAEGDHVARVRPDEQPRFAALLAMSARQRWLGRTPEQFFAEMPSLHGESFPFVLDDLLNRPSDGTLLVDDFRTLPREVSTLLGWRSRQCSCCHLPHSASRRCAAAMPIQTALVPLGRC